MLYVVSYDGYLGGYGSELYLLGVFDNPDEAIAVKEAFDLKYDEYGLEANIDEIEPNQIYDVKVKRGLVAETSIYLGGYTE